MSNNKSYYSRKLNGKIGGGQEIIEVTDDEKDKIMDLKRTFFEKTKNMKLVKYKKVLNFPNNLIPLKDYNFQRFLVTILENQEGFDTFNEIVINSFKIRDENIEIHMYMSYYEILAVRYYIDSPKGVLSIFGLTENLKPIFCLTFDTAISIPQSSFSVLKEYGEHIKRIANDNGLKISDYSNVFTPTFFQLLVQSSNSLNSLEMKSLNNFIETIKVLQKELPPSHFKK